MIDGVTAALSAQRLWSLDAIAYLVDVFTPFAFLALALAFFFAFPAVRKNKLRIYSFVIGVLLVTAAVVLVKQATAVARPCTGEPWLSKLGYCPFDYSFPSAHTAYAFSFLGASIGTSVFPVFFVLSVIVAFARIYSGVHTLNDVVGGMSIALAAYFAIESVFRVRFPHLVTRKELGKAEGGKRAGPGLELFRNLVHALIGIAFIAIAVALGREWAELTLVVGLFFGMVMMHFRMRKVSVPVVDWLFDSLERPGVTPAKGAFMYAVGLMLAFSFIPEINQALAVVAVLALGDSAATVAGKALRGPALPFNARKTVAGTFAFAVFAFGGALFFVGAWQALMLALLCAAVEAADSRVDDNLLIPLAGIAFFAVA